MPFLSAVVLDHFLHHLHHLHPHFSPCPPARSTAAASPPPSASYSQSWHKQPASSIVPNLHSLCAQAVSPAHCLSISMEEYFECVHLSFLLGQLYCAALQDYHTQGLPVSLICAVEEQVAS